MLYSCTTAQILYSEQTSYTQTDSSVITIKISQNPPNAIAMFGPPHNSKKSDLTALHSQLESACQKLSQGRYSAKFVSWNDNARTQNSCFGSNITDVRLKGKDGEDFFVVRPQNFDEKIGKIRASELAVIAGSHMALNDQVLAPKTLQDVLGSPNTYGSYCVDPSSGGKKNPEHLHFGESPETVGFPTSLLTSPDEPIGIRFQAVFLPASSSGQEVYVDSYNYQTASWEDPKNLILLCTSQGTFWQQDGLGNVPQHLHQLCGEDGWRKRYLAVSRTEHGVSISQNETAEEREAALKEGKAVATVIGTRSMGVGFNRLMTIQVPLQQVVRRGPVFQSTLGPGPNILFAMNSGAGMGSMMGNANGPVMGNGAAAGGGLFGGAAPPSSGMFGGAPPPGGCGGGGVFGSAPSYGGGSKGGGGGLFGGGGGGKGAGIMQQRLASRGWSPPRRQEAAKAARVSYGSDAGPMEYLQTKSPKRDDKCAITVTVQFYFTVSEGCLIKEEDIKKAIEVCEEAYSGCEWSGSLQKSAAANFAKDGPSTSIYNNIFPVVSKPPAPTAAAVFPAVGGGVAVPSPTASSDLSSAVNNSAGNNDDVLPPMLAVVWKAAEEKYDHSLGGLSSLTAANANPAGAFSPAEDNLAFRIHQRARTNRGFNFLHDEVGLTALDRVSGHIRFHLSSASAGISSLTPNSLFGGPATPTSSPQAHRDAGNMFSRELHAIGLVFQEAARVHFHNTNTPCGVASYNVACCFALRGMETQALQWLLQAAANGYPVIEERIANDVDLAYLRLVCPDKLWMCARLAATARGIVAGTECN